MSDPREPAQTFIHRAIDGYERVVYARNPLVQVICQIRFPTLLSLETLGAARLQESVIEEFPILESGQVFNISLSAAEGGLAANKTSQSHTFFSSDRRWQFGITANSASLSTNKYDSWESFREKLIYVFSRFYSLYKVPVCNRVGLRYQDVIDREEFGITDSTWSELINPALLGLIRDGEIDETFLKHSHSSNVMKFDMVNLLLQHGVFGKPQSNLNVFLVDADFYIEEERVLKLDDVLSDLENMHKLSGPIFRWSITEKLHNALRSA